MPSVLGRKMMAWGVIWLWIWGREHASHACPEPGVAVALLPKPRQTYMHGDVDVVAVPRVDIHSVETGTRAVDDLEPLTLLHGQIDQQRAVREVGEGLWRREGLRDAARVLGRRRGCGGDYLEGHELVVGLGGPGIHLHGALQGDDQELNALVFHWGQGRGVPRVGHQTPNPVAQPLASRLSH